jgi:hypothetical protein
MQWAIRFAFYGLHVWKWSSAPGPHYSYWVLLFMALGLCVSGASGIWLNLRLLLPSRRKASPPS